ncbi:radical SAM protein [Clostridium culturomicium]|uniref:radical SAM protein n=1 Tax=Clostridium culturomicium TaxID=1499683 RepID=UPI000590452B|nr:radical SAM protein [Clostridium culturomicium]
MRYEGTVYRPPSEGRSLIIQATIGCSHNKCTFCEMYKDKKFRMRNIDEVFEDLRSARARYSYIEKIFLADGDALIIPTNRLILILDEINSLFPECKRITVYASPKSILLKSPEELSLLKEHGLYMVYLGLESGDDTILAAVNKGASSSQLIEAGKRIKDADIKISCTLISGLGGKEKWTEHAINSAKVINEIDPDYLGLLTLRVENRLINQDVINGRLTLLSAKEVLEEAHLLIKNLDLSNCVFRSNHASNYVSLGAVLGDEKEELLQYIEEILKKDELFANADNFRLF